MTQNLVIVESPTKVKTITPFLPKGFKVVASYGHVRDLIPKSGAVDPENDFDMHYEVIERNAKYVDVIRKALKSEKVMLYLATDPDREGEAIAWHIVQLMQEKGLLENRPVHRIAFHEITQSVIEAALSHPRSIDLDLVNAQQARRALDYLVGFQLSPLLWKKLQKGLSAGRVQSPALRLIVERESEIEAFKAREYWTLDADCPHPEQPFRARLIEYRGEKLEQFSVTSGGQAEEVRHDVWKAAQGSLRVAEVERKTKKRNPPPPFITSSLQQEAAHHCGFSAKKTMMVAQQLYEGAIVGGTSVGLITYMRTDSVHVAEEAIAEIRAFVERRYGAEALPESPRVFRSKVKNAQEAHEAIRPTSVERTPEEVALDLSSDQLKLYSLIWKRTVASQVIHATIDTLAIDLMAGTEHRFRATGSTVAVPGYLSVYQETREESSKVNEDVSIALPDVKIGEIVPLKAILPEQHFTEPPPRYTEATLVKALEEYGIGRPSTYAAILSTLQQREYVVSQNKRLVPTDIGKLVNRFLTEYFGPYVDYQFTARMEDSLDEISRGEKAWIPMLREFWTPFKGAVDNVSTLVTRQQASSEMLDESCPDCGKPLLSRYGRKGRFIGCSGYPDCRYTRNLDGSQGPTVIEGKVCPQCQSPLHQKRGRFGAFIGCSNYPTCKYIESADKPVDTGVSCPVCQDGSLMKRKSHRGKIFFSCSRYPQCKYSVWNAPVAESCHQCGWPILTVKTTQKFGAQKICPRKECGAIAKE